MRKHRFSNLLYPTRGAFMFAIFAAYALPAAADTVPVVGSLLFSDNFNTTGASSDLNTEITSSARVAGPLAGLISYDTANEAGSFLLDGSALNMSGGEGMYGRVGLNYNFNNGVAEGGMKISYDYRGDGTFDIGFLYTACDSSNIPEFASGDNYNTWMMRGEVWADSQNWLFYGNYTTDIAHGYAVAGNTGVSYSDALHHADIVITDTVDGNPFNGSGLINFDYYIDGTLITSSNAALLIPDYANNYIGLQVQNGESTDNHHFENLQIYGNAAAVPEPGTLVLLVLGGMAFAWFRLRK
jgi:hypothetical protein